jgi:NADH-quinone oxidoreductase subunit M
MNTVPLISAIVFLPTVGSILVLLFGKSQQAAKYLALATALADLGASTVALAQFRPDGGRFQLQEQLSWFPAAGISYHVGVDGLSILLVFLTALLTVTAVAISLNTVQHRVREYYVVLLILETGMQGVFASLDFFQFYLFWEVMLVPMALLIGVWGHGNRIYSALKFFLYTLVGSLLMLVAIIALYFQHGSMTGIYSLDIPTLINPPEPYPLIFQRWAWLAFALAFAIKVPLFPLHTWLPDAHVDAPTAGSVLLAGVLLKMGGYGFLRFNLPMFPEASQFFAPIVIALSVIAIVYGALVALAQPDLKKLVAYSSVSHMGFVMLGIFVFNLQGAQGAVVQMFSHGLSTGGLFLAVGVIYERLHSRLLDDMGGLASRMPTFAVFFGIFMLSSLGLPATSGFVGEFLALLGAFQFQWWLGALASLGVILAAVYVLFMAQKVLFLQPRPNSVDFKDVHGWEVVAMLPVAALVLAVGIYPAPLLGLAEPSISAILQQAVQGANAVMGLGGR